MVVVMVVVITAQAVVACIIRDSKNREQQKRTRAWTWTQPQVTMTKVTMNSKAGVQSDGVNGNCDHAHASWHPSCVDTQGKATRTFNARDNDDRNLE
eukprot:374030-Alexandrium_andersonii.AAC.1